MKHLITLTVENQPGVLARIVGLISGRGYNIESLNVGPSHDSNVSRMTMSVGGDEHVLEQVMKQLNKMIDVIKVTDLTAGSKLDRELILIEVSTPKNKRGEIMEIASMFKAELVGIRESSVTLQFVGDQGSISEFIRMLSPFNILDLSRSGPMAVARAE